MFGFHLASIDLRQSSDIHETVITELMARAGMVADYAALSEEEKRAVLLKELAQLRPLRLPYAEYSDLARSELGVLEEARITHEKFGARGA